MVVVQSLAILQELFVSSENVRDVTSLLTKSFGTDLFRSLAMILREADAAQDVARSQFIRIDLQLGHGQLYGGDLVVVVVNGEVARQSGGGSIAPQKPSAKRMKRGNPGLPGRDTGAQQQIRDAVAHFFRGLVCESDRQNRARRHAP